MKDTRQQLITGFAPGEREYVRRELGQFFSTLPTVAEEFRLRVWKDMPNAADWYRLGQDQPIPHVAPRNPIRERTWRRRYFIEDDARRLDNVRFRHLEQPDPERLDPIDRIIVLVRPYQDVRIKEIERHLAAERSSCSSDDTEAGPTPRIFAARVCDTISSCSARRTTLRSPAPSR